LKFKLTFAALILLSLACSLLAPAAATPTKPADATRLPALDATVTLEAASAPIVEEAPTEAPVEEIKFGRSAREHITAITEKIGARWSGTEEEAETARYIEEQFTKIGYAPEVKTFRRSGWVDDETEDMFNSANVIATREGESGQVIVVGAHYDSVDDGLGADDNASGVGILLELAALLADVPTPHTIQFIALGAEEAGLLGSVDYIYSASPDEIKNIIGFINLDSVIAGDIIYVYSNEGKPALRDWALNWADANGYLLETIRNVDLKDEDGYGTADTDAFESAGIPFAYFESANWELGDKDGYTQVDPQYGEDGAIIHTEYDSLEYLDKTFPGRVDEHLNTIITILYNLLTQIPNPPPPS
jgi:alkaline phosphatase isozyme conversion protein